MLCRRIRCAYQDVVGRIGFLGAMQNLVRRVGLRRSETSLIDPIRFGGSKSRAGQWSRRAPCGSRRAESGMVLRPPLRCMMICKARCSLMSLTVPLDGEYRDCERPDAGSVQLSSRGMVFMDNETSKRLDELASRIRKEVESMANPGEKWTVSDSPRISVTLYNPGNPTAGRGTQIDASNCDELKSVMESLRSYWEQRALEDDQYARSLLNKLGSEN